MRRFSDSVTLQFPSLVPFGTSSFYHESLTAVTILHESTKTLGLSDATIFHGFAACSWDLCHNELLRSLG